MRDCRSDTRSLAHFCFICSITANRDEFYDLLSIITWAYGGHRRQTNARRLERLKKLT